MEMKKDIQRLPLKLTPAPVERVWGGDGVHRVLGWTPPKGKTIGEWWILSFRHDHPSIIEEGDYKGIPLPQLTAAHPELLGSFREPALLVKIIDSAARLSVQVHPDDNLAEGMGLDSGKTECWYYLESDPGASIFCGLKPGVNPDAFLDKAAQNPPAEEMIADMNTIPVRAGALSFIPAGTIHAIGEGVLLLEVQQNSDTTFRIYDWGRPREVHLKEALQAILQSSPEPHEVNEHAESGVIVSCGKFSVHKVPFEKEGFLDPLGDEYASITCLEGEGEIGSGEYRSAFRKGDTYFLPAGCPGLDVSSPGRTLWMLSRQKKD